MSATSADDGLSVDVDVNLGDPTPAGSRPIELPRLLGGTIRLRGYPIAMAHVASRRGAEPQPLATVLGGYPHIAQPR